MRNGRRNWRGQEKDFGRVLYARGASLRRLSIQGRAYGLFTMSFEAGLEKKKTYL